MFISKKELTYLTNKVDELELAISCINNIHGKMYDRISRLEQIAKMESPTKSQLRAKKAMKIEVKGTPGRPKKVCVKVKQPRTKDGKFAKKK